MGRTLTVLVLPASPASRSTCVGGIAKVGSLPVGTAWWGLRGLELRAKYAVGYRTDLRPVANRLVCNNISAATAAQLEPQSWPTGTLNCRRTPRKDWQSAAKGAVLSEIPAEILPCRLERRGGASVVRREAAINRTEDLNVKVCEEAVTRKICIVRAVC
jgi:hypothetical protein